jgi:hypothetical protein
MNMDLFGPPSIFNPMVGPTINVGDQLLASIIYSSNQEIFFHDPDLFPLCSYIVQTPSEELDDISLHDLAFVPPNKIAGTGSLYQFSPVQIQDQWNFLTDDVISYVFTNCVHVGDEEIMETTDSFLVYPTISDSKIFIKNREQNHDKITLQYFDLNGRLCQYMEFYNETDIDVSGLAKGFYLILLTRTGITECHKVIVN